MHFLSMLHYYYEPIKNSAIYTETVINIITIIIKVWQNCPKAHHQ